MAASKEQARPLHLQTIESLFVELIGGGAVQVDGRETFSLSADESRAILNWYRLNQGKWAGNVATKDVEAIVDSQTAAIPALPVPALGTPGKKRRLRLVRLEAHRFAGIHAYGTYDNPPPNFVFEPREAITLFEGWNGAGKTSLLNAAVWCLTGQILRPQRPPEPCEEEFEGHFARHNGGDVEITAHGLTAITPLPDPAIYMPPAGKGVPLDSWVEVTFVDEDGTTLPPVRRTQVRNSRNKVTESVSGLDSVGVDPIALKTGTTMPALLPFLRIGAASELGLAAAKLTGLAEVSSLAKHAAKVRDKLNGDFRKDRQTEIEEIDGRFIQAQTDLQTQINNYPSMAPKGPLPAPSAAKDLEEALQNLEQHFTGLKAESLQAAKTILGVGFDPADKLSRDNLEASIGPAQGQLKTLGQLTSAHRLKSLAEIEQEEWQAVDALLAQLRSEADTLAELATTPELGRRKQLYARVADWIAEGGGHDYSNCDVCNRTLKGITDPVTKRAVSEHLAEVDATEKALLAQSQQKWATGWVNRLSAECPNALKSELKVNLLDDPAALMRTALVEELFETEAFSGALTPLKAGVERLFDKERAALPAFTEAVVEELAGAVAVSTATLMATIKRIGRAKAFANWRNSNTAAIASFMQAVLRGPDTADAKVTEMTPVGRKLDALDSIIKGAAPLNAALDYCGRMATQLTLRRAKEKRLALYDRAVSALAPVIKLGELAEAQVASLRTKLHGRDVYWRDQCYGNAFALAGHELRETAMDVKGVLDISVGSEKTTAPAQHVSNASALRASVMGFFLAFWEHVLKQHGGLALLIMDDPQDLLDDDNRVKLARLLPDLVGEGAQIIVTTYDRFFAREVAAAGRKNAMVEHRSVHPVNVNNNILRTAVATEELDRRRDAYEADKDNAVLAQNYAGEVRVFLEARLADMFDDPAYPAYAYPSAAPALSDYVGRLRGLEKAAPNALFRGKAVKDFCSCPSLVTGSDAMKVLNTPHHEKASLSAGAVYAVHEELDHVRRLAEKMHMEFRLFRWHEPLKEGTAASNVVPFKPMTIPSFKTLIHPDLAAFTAHSVPDATQDAASDLLTEGWFADKSLFYIRVDNLGFALPAGCIAIVENTPYEGRDHNIVIARLPGNTLARRLFRPPTGDQLLLAAESPNPRLSKPTLAVDANTVAVHRIVGMLTEQPAPPIGKGEATELPSAASLSQIRTAYRVREDSGIPLALPGQTVLGGEEVLPNQLSSFEDSLVALTLADGSSLFKRVGSAVPGTAGRLWQFESIGGLGSSLVVSLSEEHAKDGMPIFASARRVVGVLYAD